MSSTDSGIWRGQIGPRGVLAKNINGQNGGVVTLTVDEAKFRQIVFSGTVQGAIQIKIPGAPGMYWDILNHCVHSDTEWYLVVTNIHGLGTVNISQGAGRRVYITASGLVDYVPDDMIQNLVPVWSWTGGNNGRAIANGVTAVDLERQDLQTMHLRFTGGNQDCTVTFQSPAPDQVWTIHNARANATTVIGSTDIGDGVTIAANRMAIVVFDAGQEMMRVTPDTDPAT